MDGIHQGTNGGTFWEVMGPKLQQKKLWDQNETFFIVMGQKLQQKKLWDQNETFVIVMGLKVHLSQQFIWVINWQFLIERSLN